MAVIKSISAKSVNGKHEILLRYKSGKFASRAKSGIFTLPNWFDFVVGNKSETPYKGKRVITDEIKQTQSFHEQQKIKLSELEALINETSKTAERNIPEWFVDCVDKYYQRGKYTPKAEQPKQTFFDTFEEFLIKHPLSEVRRKNFRVVYRVLKRFEMYICKTDRERRNFKLELGGITPDTLQAFSDFLKKEHELFHTLPELYEHIPEYHEQKPRGQNTVNDIFKKLRTFFLWCYRHNKTQNRPFDSFKIDECVYGTPFYITIDERNTLYKLDLTSRPELETQRDIFVFQCLVGCRVSDLYSFTKANVISDAIEYIARKTKDSKPITVRVPLNSIAKEILDKYADFEGKTLLPFISQQKYNVAIKKAFELAGITRSVIICDPLTRENVIRPINEVASSHLARRCFVGNMYKKAKDQNLVAALSGHKQNSKAFARYREIDEEMKRELVSLIE